MGVAGNFCHRKVSDLQLSAMPLPFCLVSKRIHRHEETFMGFDIYKALATTRRKARMS